MSLNKAIEHGKEKRRPYRGHCEETGCNWCFPLPRPCHAKALDRAALDRKSLNAYYADPSDVFTRLNGGWEWGVDS